MIVPATDTAAAVWLHTPGGWPVIDFGPPGFAAYARLRFIPDPVQPRQRESEVDLADDHPHDLVQTVRALRLLGPHTSAPSEVTFAVWDGWGELPDGAPTVELPHRRYALLQGALTDLSSWPSLPGPAPDVPPALAWPADHAWCWASDVDPHWAGIGASVAAIDALVAAGLDVVRADPTGRQPAYL